MSWRARATLSGVATAGRPPFRPLAVAAVQLDGMPGLEKKLARYLQLYSHMGFVHGFKPLREAEMRLVAARHAATFGIAYPDSLAGIEALAAVIRLTRGNLRLVERLPGCVLIQSSPRTSSPVMSALTPTLPQAGSRQQLMSKSPTFRQHPPPARQSTRSATRKSGMRQTHA